MENSLWMNFSEAIRSAYVVPSKFRLSESSLDLEHHRGIAKALEKIAGANAVAIKCDGWSNLRNDPIINFVVSIPQPIFRKLIHLE